MTWQTRQVLAFVVNKKVGMVRQPVSSSNIASVGYERASMTLEVEFRNGHIYQYLNVPEQTYVGLMSAPSAGRYLNLHVRDAYRYSRV